MNRAIGNNGVHWKVSSPALTSGIWDVLWRRDVRRTMEPLERGFWTPLIAPHSNGLNFEAIDDVCFGEATFWKNELGNGPLMCVLRGKRELSARNRYFDLLHELVVSLKTRGTSVEMWEDYSPMTKFGRLVKSSLKSSLNHFRITHLLKNRNAT